MRNIILRTTALTLLELIVSMMLVSVVLFGLFSVSMVLTNNSQDYGQRFLLNSQTQATLSHILNNASLAVKDISSGEPGIFISMATNPEFFCIHQNISNTILPADDTPLNTPGVYSNDRWLCYTLSNYQINYCAMQYVAGASPWGAASCDGVANSTFLGTAYSITTSTPPTFSNGVFSITIQNCLDDTAASCFNADPTLQDPVNNPQVTKSGSVACLQQGNG